MRLLNVNTLKLVEFSEDKRPAYAIASHRWDEHEATFADVRDAQNTASVGYQKVKDFAEYVEKHVSGVDWLWIDTCCINKDSAAELSKAINLMFEWYRQADVCLAYLRDVEEAGDEVRFQQSEWFERGWTLQELLAPRTVVFLTRTWEVIGNKGASTNEYNRTNVGDSLEEVIAKTTHVPREVLQEYERSSQLSTQEKIRWMEGRKTTEEEDLSYALFGILNVSLAVIYGERGRARDRLLAVIREREELEIRQAELYRKISSWISPVDPCENHRAARKQHEPATGAWLLQSESYRAWKAGSNDHRHLWLYGPAGSGKTILCSTAIEDVQMQCRSRTNIGQAIFYFSFSDQTKQTYESFVRSIVVQLGCREPGFSLLRQAYEKPEHKTPGADELHRILTTIVASYDQVFLHLDGLDECLGEQDARLDILASLEILLQDLPRIRMIATSRDYPEIRSRMESIKATLTPLDRRAVDSDIQRFISTQLAQDTHLRQWPASSRKLVEETLAHKAQGM
jgi:hypothetical protein